MSLQVTVRVYVLLEFANGVPQPTLQVYNSKKLCRSQVETILHTRGADSRGWGALLEGEMLLLNRGSLMLHQQELVSRKGTIAFDS